MWGRVTSREVGGGLFLGLGVTASILYPHPPFSSTQIESWEQFRALFQVTLFLSTNTWISGFTVRGWGWGRIVVSLLSLRKSVSLELSSLKSVNTSVLIVTTQYKKQHNSVV